MVEGDELILTENKYQQGLRQRILDRFPGSIILKNDPNYIQGIPDLLVLYGPYWAMLEVKKETHAHHQPNQDYYVKKLNEMSFSSFIYPENEEVVLDGMERAFRLKQ